MKKLIGIFIFGLGLISCGSDPNTVKQEGSVPAVEETVSNEISIKATDDMKFDKTEFTVKADEEITLNFTNAGVLPIETMGHNVVVLEKNTDVAQFANASAKAKETDFISELYLTDIVAHTKLLGPGESETIKFNLKEPGEYTFICTFPGHWIAMKGTITAI
ncbi:MAG TPA: plastocyanin/azurin family copper-binding protein [Moheibacter sp.]|nr:plastocyanin/azurin family copper-binding protein [Moheibacter sp.]